MGRGLRIGFPAPGSGSTIDFTTASLQNPLSLSGTWSNNSQGVGGNTAPGILSSMRIIAAASGGINIAAGDANGQDSPFDYMDSFAFKPGYPGNQRITATLFVDPGYNPSDNHEIELILGCSTNTNYHKWIECLWSLGGNQDIILLDGVASDFTPLSPNNSNALPGYAPHNNDVFMAELYRSTNTVKWYINSTQICDKTSGLISSLGDGVGIASFRRTAGGTSAANRIGFKNVLIEAF